MNVYILLEGVICTRLPAAVLLGLALQQYSILLAVQSITKHRGAHGGVVSYVSYIHMTRIHAKTVSHD